MTEVVIPLDHPRAKSLRAREMLIRGYEAGVVALQGLITHGRGEAFDYLLGEKTTEPTMKAIRAASATLLLAKHPVISVNGNVATLAAKDVVELAEATGSGIEVNLFHRSPEREKVVGRRLAEAGAREILGIGEVASCRIPELNSERRRVDPRGIYSADVVLVPLEDGDRAEALRRMGKTVIAIDLNPLSRTARSASITIVDNVVRALPLLTKEGRRLRGIGRRELRRMVQGFDNRENMMEGIRLMVEELLEMVEKRETWPDALGTSAK